MLKRLGTCLALALPMAPLSAEEPKSELFERPPTVEELRKALMPTAPLVASTRGMQIKMKEVGEPQNTEPPKASLAVRFHSGSAELTHEAKSMLDILIESINGSELKYYTFQIEGHTDAVGDEKYNLVLSEKRAASVKKYLVVAGGVDPEMLRTQGFGEAKPLFENDPLNPKNRRVDIVNVGP